LCEQCPVRRECGERGKVEQYGIWAGFDVATERDELCRWLDPSWTPDVEDVAEPVPVECDVCGKEFTPGRKRFAKTTTCPECRQGLADATIMWPHIDALLDSGESARGLARRAGINRTTAHSLCRRDGGRQRYATAETVAAIKRVPLPAVPA
ncbi:hypothetical protein ACFXOH_24245, partial [Bacillus subtilis]